MTERQSGAEAPRWKQSCVDVLSWMLFLLKVPVKHKLVRLWYAIDWQAINRIAAKLDKNAHGGRAAWAHVACQMHCGDPVQTNPRTYEQS